jgi:hypothetical protein
MVPPPLRLPARHNRRGGSTVGFMDKPVGVEEDALDLLCAEHVAVLNGTVVREVITYVEVPRQRPSSRR